MRDPRMTDALERIYQAFAAYPRPADVAFCEYCYDPREIDYFRKTPLRQFDPEMARTLVWEAGDHWPDAATYKHYLPLILEALAPPRRCEDLHDDHLFDTLRAMKFEEWPTPEREAFWTYVVAAHDALAAIDRRQAWEWKVAASKLPGGPYRFESIPETPDL